MLEGLDGLVREPHQPIRTYANNSVLLIPEAPTAEEDRALCRKVARELAERIFAGEVTPYAERYA